MAQLATPEVIVPIDKNHSETDAAWGDDMSVYHFTFATETTSLASSITNYRYENGRRYHAYKEGEYWGPNDKKQNDQLDIGHHTFFLLFDGKLFQAPIGKNPQVRDIYNGVKDDSWRTLVLMERQRVLDVGTGTGIWALDFADQFPSATIIGTDLSPIQPSWVPPNCKFEIDDAASEWTFADNSFDFIHVRGLYGSLRDWPAFYRQVYQHLKPGGWYEQVECSVHWRADDGSIPTDHVFQRSSDIFVEAGEKMGKTFRILDLQKQYLLDAGFENVVEKRYKMPVGPWSSDPKLKEVGRWHLLECFEGMEGWSMALLTRVMGWTINEVRAFLAEVRKGLNDRKLHAYTSVSVVYGQKPAAK